MPWTAVAVLRWLAFPEAHKCHHHQGSRLEKHRAIGRHLCEHASTGKVDVHKHPRRAETHVKPFLVAPGVFSLVSVYVVCNFDHGCLAAALTIAKGRTQSPKATINLNGTSAKRLLVALNLPRSVLRRNTGRNGFRLRRPTNRNEIAIRAGCFRTQYFD